MMAARRSRRLNEWFDRFGVESEHEPVPPVGFYLFEFGWIQMSVTDSRMESLSSSSSPSSTPSASSSSWEGGDREMLSGSGGGSVASHVRACDLHQVIDSNGLPADGGSDAEALSVEGEGRDEIVLASEIDRANQTDFCEPRSGPGPVRLKGRARFEAWLETLVSRNRFCHKILSRIYLPLAFHSGLRMKEVDSNTYTYILPFRRFNKNWYKAMAGAALVANSEISAGLYLMREIRGRWTVVCRHMSYRFLRPCFGPAIYRITPVQDLATMMATGAEFNVDLVIDIIQQAAQSRARQPKVGRCNITFHVTPKDPDGNLKLHKRHLLRARKKMRDGT